MAEEFSGSGYEKEKDVCDKSESWDVLLEKGNRLINTGKSAEAVDCWISSFEKMDVSDFDKSFDKVAGLYENYLFSTLWKSIEELDLTGLDRLANTLFFKFPEKRSEDTDLFVVLLKRMANHLDDVKHVRYLVELLDASVMIARMYFDVNVEIRTHMYVYDIVLKLGSQVVIKTLPLLKSASDSEETLRTVRIVTSMMSMFTALRERVYAELDKRSRKEVDSLVVSWSERNSDLYLAHLDEAFAISMSAYSDGDVCPQTAEDERDREIDAFVNVYFGN